MPFDVEAVRKRFSALSDDFVFLDAPGGSQLPDEVGEAVARVYREAAGNYGAPYATSRRIGAIVTECRAATARFLGCDPDEVIFGGSMTALNFTLTRTLGRTLRAGDEIIVTRLDHDANIAPWLELARDLDLVVKLADVHPDTTLDLADLERQLGPRSKVVAFSWASNAAGTIVDARAVCELAHQAGALAWIDAVQYAPHEPMDMRAVGADVLLCSPYKFCGPHVGVACGRGELLETWRPYKVRPSADKPVGHRFETGTLPYELLAGLTASLSYLDSIGGLAAASAWERELGERLLAGLPAGGPAVRAARHGRPGPDLPAQLPRHQLGHAVARRWRERGFGVWSGENYYAPGLYERVAWGDALRVGLAHYNTLAEVDRFNQTLGDLVAQLG